MVGGHVANVNIVRVRISLFALWAVSASGNTFALHAKMKGSIPLRSTAVLGRSSLGSALV